MRHKSFRYFCIFFKAKFAREVSPAVNSCTLEVTILYPSISGRCSLSMLDSVDKQTDILCSLQDQIAHFVQSNLDIHRL